MFFRKAFNGFNDWWRYVIVLLAIVLGHTIGQIPLVLALNRSLSTDGTMSSNALEQFTENPNFESFGINSNMGFALLLLMFVAALTAFFFIFKPIHQREFKTLITPSSRIAWHKIFFAFTVWLGLALGMETIAYLLAPEHYTFQFKLNTFIPLVILSALMLPIQTSLEELLFRGYLFQGIGTKKLKQIIPFSLAIVLGVVSFNIAVKLSEDLNHLHDSISVPHVLALGISFISIFIFYKILSLLVNQLSKDETSWLNKNFKIIPILMTAIMFGFMHAMNPEIEEFGFGIMQVYYISAGIAFGIMTIMDDSLELALGVHAATNFAGAVFVGYDGAAIQTDSLFKTSNLNPAFMAIGFIVISIIFLFIASKKYNWESFSKIFSSIDQSDHLV